MKKHTGAQYCASALGLLLSGSCMLAQYADVSAQIRMLPPRTEAAAHAPHSRPAAPLHAVVWLSPLEGKKDPMPQPPTATYTLVQKNKEFTPHLLVVPVGSTVLFPNEDPFFHNVFSLFNGRRFDLGLYEAGSTRAVRFSREGVSYIFCNIHPEMSAVVLTLSTPFFAIAGQHDSVVMHGVPPGQYRLHVWSEGAELERLDALTRVVRIPASNTYLGTIDIPQPADLATQHKNKFGKDYDEKAAPLY